MEEALTYATLGYLSEDALQEPAVGLATLGYVAELSGDIVLRATLTGTGAVRATLIVAKQLQLTLEGHGTAVVGLQVSKYLAAVLSGEGAFSPDMTVVVPWVEIVDNAVYIAPVVEEDVER